MLPTNLKHVSAVISGIVSIFTSRVWLISGQFCCAIVQNKITSIIGPV